MAKFLVEASYTAEGLKGLAQEKASGRKAALKKALSSVGGKLESIYWALGESDVYVICDCPNHVSAAALSLAATASGLVKTKTIALLTAEEVDEALAKAVSYRPPGA